MLLISLESAIMSDQDARKSEALAAEPQMDVLIPMHQQQLQQQHQQQQQQRSAASKNLK